MLRHLFQAFARLTYNQWIKLISLLVLLNLLVMGGLLWIIVSDLSPQHTPFTQLALAQAPATRTAEPTFTSAPVQPTMTPLPSATNTAVPTWTPTITPTPPPTATPTVTSTPTNTPIVVQVRSRPRATATPTPTPTPNVDFVASVRQLTPCENQGKHHIFITVVDQLGNGIPHVPVKISWVGGEAIVKTGTKAEDPGLADFAMFKGRYQVEVLGALSEVAGPITPDIPKDEPCHENGNSVANSLFHYSYDVQFKKVR